MPDTTEERIEKVRDVSKVQSASANYNSSEYMRGMANGLILALAILDDKDPIYKEQFPKVIQSPN